MNDRDEVVGRALNSVADQATPPRLNADALWRSGRRRRLTAVTASVASAATAAIVIPLAVLGGGSSAPGVAPVAQGSSQPYPLQTIAAPPTVRFSEVVKIVDHRCTPGSGGVPGEADTPPCIYVNSTGMTVTRFVSGQVIKHGPQEYVARLTLNPADARRFTDLTTRLNGQPFPRNDFVVIVHGRVICLAGQVMGIIHDGVLEFDVGTRAQAEQFLHTLGVH